MGFAFIKNVLQSLFYDYSFISEITIGMTIHACLKYPQKTCAHEWSKLLGGDF